MPVTHEVAGPSPAEVATLPMRIGRVTTIVCRFGNYLIKNKLSRYGGGKFFWFALRIKWLMRKRNSSCVMDDKHETRGDTCVRAKLNQQYR